MNVSGMVKTHAQTMLPTIPHRTADKRFVEPTPMIDDEMTWVVLTGMPQWEATAIIKDDVVSAAKPCTGSNLIILEPSV